MNKISSFSYFSQFILAFLFLLSGACNNTKRLKTSKAPNYQKLIEQSPVFNKAFTGFYLYDPARQEVLYSKNANRYFNPASTTKLFTFYTCLHILGDSIPALRYTEQNDSLIFWGTGDPSLANPHLSYNDQVFRFLKKQNKALFFSGTNFRDQHFGSGWQWDDYYYAYQAEKGALPFHGNIIEVKKEKKNPRFQVEPDYFSTSFLLNESLSGRSLKRQGNNNIFEYNKTIQANSYNRNHPFIYSDALVIDLLSDAIDKPIKILKDYELKNTTASQYIYATASDTLYQRMLQESDNFIAEQLLLLCSDALFSNLNTRQVIDFAKDNLMQDFPDVPIWVDGSGLSRYNLLTPRTVVFLLEKIQKEVAEDRLFQLLPAGGVSGTIEDWYGAEQPYIFAKTGTFSNNHCLSGYLITASGRKLIFSFMHNNYKGSSRPYKEEMERVLKAIHQEIK